MTISIGFPQLEVIPGTCLKRLTADFRAYSDTLKCWILIPDGFVYDEESTPWKGDNPLGGLVHDYLCRKDSKPLVTKWQAAMVYLEFQGYEDELNERPWYKRGWDCMWRGIKAGFVGVTPLPRFFHVLPVNATAEDIM